MSHYRRKKVFGGYYFFTVVAYKRREFLTDDAVRPLLKEAFYDVRQKLPFKTHAFCLLPNHLHCLWQMPTESCDYSKRWSIIKRTFSKKYLAAGGEELQQSNSRRKKRESGVWQRFFGSILFGTGRISTIICIIFITILSSMNIVNTLSSGPIRRIKRIVTKSIMDSIGVALRWMIFMITLSSTSEFSVGMAHPTKNG